MGWDVTYPHIHTELVPPGLDDQEDGPPRLMIGAWLNEGDDTTRAGVTSLDPDADDASIADAMVRCMEAAAAMRGPTLWVALWQRMREPHDRGSAGG